MPKDPSSACTLCFVLEGVFCCHSALYLFSLFFHHEQYFHSHFILAFLFAFYLITDITNRAMATIIWTCPCTKVLCVSFLIVYVFILTGFTLKITKGMRLLTVVTIAPRDIKGQTLGLLGNYDGNPDNDYVLPNGNIIGPNITERELYYNFGQKCKCHLVILS